MKKIISNKAVLIVSGFFLLSFAISTIWFRRGLIFATAEEGMPFYSPEKAARLYSFPWNENGTGYLVPTILPRAPFMHLVSLVNDCTGNVVAEAIVFGLLIFSGITGMFFFVKYLTSNYLISVVSGLYYFFNLYSMSQIWARAIFAGFFVWSFLPIFLYLWILWLARGRLKDLLIFLLANFVFSASFAAPANIFSVWIPAGVYLVVNLFERKQKSAFKVLLKRFLVGVFLWAFTNFWWIYPYFSLSGHAFSEVSNLNDILVSLDGVSRSFPISEILQLKQKSYFNTSANPQAPWGSFYEKPFARLISLVVLAITIFGFIGWKKKRYKRFVIPLFFLSLFISKGTNFPLGYTFYKWLFSSFSFTTVLRNPYEKFGVVFLLSYSILFAQGVFWFLQRFKYNRLVVLGVSFVLVLYFGFLVHPLWTGKVFRDYYFIRVPDSYKKVNEMISKDEDDFRILVSPMIPDHGVAYIWGYQGDEPSAILLDKRSISKFIHYPLYGTKYKELLDTIAGNENYNQLLEELNAKYILVHKDIETDKVGSISSEQMLNILSKNSKVKLIGDFGELLVFEYQREGFGDFEVQPVTGVAKLSYKKINPGSYEVKLQGATGPFRLIFKQTYSDYWRAKIGGEVVGTHQVVYGYANGWNIDKRGDIIVDVSLKIWPWE